MAICRLLRIIKNHTKLVSQFTLPALLQYLAEVGQKIALNLTKMKMQISDV